MVWTFTISQIPVKSVSMKNLVSVLPILSAVPRVAETPNDLGITVPENVGTDARGVSGHLFDLLVLP